MNPARLMTQRCTLHVTELTEDGPRDDYGNVVPVSFDVPDVKCLLQQTQNVSQRGESGAGLAEVQTESFRVLLPARIVRLVEDVEVEVKPDGIDSITVDGDDYELSGPPWRVHNPRLRRVTHVEATVKRAQ